MTKPESTREEGFSLVELLVVVLILGILATVAIPVYLNHREDAQRTAVYSDLRNVAVHAESFFAANQTYSGFDTHASFVGFNHSDGVSFAVDPADLTVDDYCIEASHAEIAGRTWRVTVDGGVAEASCP